MAVPGGVVGADGVAAIHLDRLSGKLCQVFYLVSRSLPQFAHQGHILPVRTASAQDAGEGVLAHKGPGGHGTEAVVPQDIAQLHQPVVIVAVAVQHHRDGQGPLPMDHIPDVGQQQIGHPAGIDRGAHHRQILRAEGQGLLPGLGQVEAIGLIPGPQPLRQILRQGGDHLLRGPGAAEIDGVYSFDVHVRSSSVSFRALCSGSFKSSGAHK